MGRQRKDHIRLSGGLGGVEGRGRKVQNSENSEAVRRGSAKAARAEEGRVWKVAQQHVREALDSCHG